ncbi:MAG: TA system VapC family ribonuclease toxin [Terracidiphilus sp.]|jgi:toxin-antitoxin system PIN domain toxin
MTSLLFPDVNVWVALNYQHHVHNGVAQGWYEDLPTRARLVFCRQTQLGLFRILTTTAVMEQDVLSQQASWHLYDRWVSTGQLVWADEPQDLETPLRNMTAAGTASPKVWMDAYLTAFVETANLTLVTFDRALAGKTNRSLLLG